MLQKRQLYKSLFRNASVGIAFGDREGRLTRVNQKFCSLLGYSEEELLGISFRDFTYPEDVEKDNSLFAFLTSGVIETYKMEKRYVRKDGTFFWGLLTTWMATQNDGTDTIVGMVQNIDADKREELALQERKERLVQHNAYKDRLFSVIAHDLRGPVGNAVGLLELLEKKSGSFSKEKIDELMSQLRRSMSGTSELLENLLTWSHSQFRENSFKPASLLLSGEVAKVAEQLRQQARQKSITLNVSVPKELSVQADMQMLHIILRNLVSNGIKFSDAGKTVTVGAVMEGSLVHVSVKDEGTGMSEENRLKLLDRNTEGYTSYGTKGEKGIGLGINLCIDYIERNGGSLQISSEQGKGSTFTFALPAAEA